MSLLLLFADNEPSIDRDRDAYSTTGGIDVEVTWSGATDPATKIVIALDSAGVGVFVDWVYTDGTQVEPGAVTSSGSHSFTVPSTAGTYVARMILDDTVLPTLTRLWKTSGGASAFDAGASTPAQYTGDVEITARRLRVNDQNAIGFQDAADVDEDYVMDAGALIADSGNVYRVTGGSFSSLGTVIGLGDYYRIARTISDGAVKIYTSTDGVSWTLRDTHPTTMSGTLIVDTSLSLSLGVNTVEVTEGGLPSAPTWSNPSGNLDIGTPSVAEPNATSYAASAAITVTFEGSISAGDWIQVIADGADPFNAASTINWKYTDNTQVLPGSVTASGSVVFLAPGTPGTYQIYMMHNGLYIPVTKPVTITVT